MLIYDDLYVGLKYDMSSSLDTRGNCYELCTLVGLNAKVDVGLIR